MKRELVQNICKALDVEGAGDILDAVNQVVAERTQAQKHVAGLQGLLGRLRIITLVIADGQVLGFAIDQNETVLTHREAVGMQRAIRGFADQALDNTIQQLLGMEIREQLENEKSQEVDDEV